MYMDLNATPQEKYIFGDPVQLLFRSDDCSIYKISNELGEALVTKYPVFPGIDLIYNHVKGCNGIIKRRYPGNILEINHCKDGRAEREFNDEFLYLSSGDLSIISKNNVAYGIYFPLSYYHGIDIVIDIDKAPKCLSCFLDDVDVRPKILAEKFCYDNRCFISRSESYVEHIFSELYNVPENIRKGYFKVKILELLLFLKGMNVNFNESKKHIILKNHAVLAKNICEYLTNNMDSRITLQELSETFNASGTQIKTAFKAVYGTSIYSYIRTQKMQAATKMLKETDYTILDIAGCFGYDNGSKFAKAFKDIMGVTPNEYRNKTQLHQDV